MSPASSVTHAGATPWLAHQARTAVVLPYPAGAATSVNDATTDAARDRLVADWVAAGDPEGR